MPYFFYLACIISIGITIAVIVGYIRILRKNRDQLKDKVIGMLQEKEKLVVGGKEALVQSNIYKRFYIISLQAAEKMPDTDEWQELSEEINRCFPQFTNNLMLLHQFSDIELKVTLLVKCGFLPKDIAYITMRSKESVTSIRRRLTQKVLKTNPPTPKEWDDFVNSL